MEENNNYFSNLMNTGVEYAQQQIGPNGVIQLSRPFSQSQRPDNGYNILSPWQENLYNNPNPINPEDWSKYDLTSGNQDDWADGQRMNYLQHAQSTAEKIGNSLVNNLVIAGTTAVSDILTIPMGLFTVATGGNFIENPINRWAVDSQNKTQQALPIYRGSDYESKNLLGKMGTDVFWADLIQNLGFTEGMLVSSLALSYLKLPSVAISLISSIGEGSVEAINRKDQTLQEQNEALSQSFNKMLPDAIKNGKTDELYKQYTDTKQQMESDAIKSQNLIFAGNIALLTLTNQIEFGRYLSKGYDTERRFFKSIARNADNTFKDISKTQALLRGAGIGMLNASTEAFEEFSQDVLQRQPSMFENFNHFNSSVFNPEKKQLASNLWESYWDSLVATINDPQTAVDAMTGFITGMFGMPHRQMTSSGQKTQSWAGGLPGAINEAFSARTNTNEVIRQINQFIQNDDQTKAYYQSLVRDLVLQDEQNLALEKDDKKAYEDSKSARAINEILLYSHIGKTDELKQKINSYLNMSDQELQQIVNEIKTKKEDGEYTIDELKNSIQKRAEYLNQKIDFIDKTKKHLLSKNPLLSDKSLESLLFLESQINDWQNRSNELTKKSFESFKKIMDQIDQNLATPAGPNQSYVKNGKLFVDDSRTLRLYEPGESTVEYYIDNEGKQHKRRKAIVKQNDNGTYSIIKNPLNIKENDGTIFVADKDTLLKSDIPGQYVYISRQVNENAFKFGVTISQDYRDALKEAAESSVDLDTDEINEFVDNIDDIAEIQKSLDNFYKQRKDVYENINKQNEVEDKKEAEVAKEETVKTSKRNEKEFKDVKSVKELRDKLRSSKLSDQQKQQILDKLDKDGNQIVKQYRQLDKYRNEVIGKIKTMTSNQDYIDYATSLVNSGFYKSETLNDFANPNAGWINDIDFFKNHANKPVNYREIYGIASYMVQRALTEINASEAYKSQFDSSYKKMTIEDPFKGSTNLNPSAVVYVNDQPVIDPKTKKPLKSSSDVTPVSKTTIEEEIDGISEQQDKEPPKKTYSSGVKPRSQYYRPAIPEYAKEQIKKRKFRDKDGKIIDFAEYMQKEGKGDFRALYDYLKINGAFDYINNGKLSPTAKIGFMIDPGFKINDQFVVFMVDLSNNQIVGSLNNSSSTTEYIGLQSVLDNIYSEYDEFLKSNPDNQDKFYSKSSTEVSQVMNGNIAYSDEEKTLDSSVEGGVKYVTQDKTGNKVQPVLGIMKNMRMVTNRKIADEDIIMPLNASRYSGRVFLLIPTATNKYFAVPVRTKHFNESEFNLKSDQLVRNTFIGKTLLDSFNKLADISTYNDLLQIMPQIARELYIGGIHINLLNAEGHRLDLKSNDEIATIQIVKELQDDDGYALGAGRQEIVEYVNLYETESVEGAIEEITTSEKRSHDDILNDLLDVFMKMNPQIQIDINAINSGTYNTDIIESQILSTNIEFGRIINSWFTVKYFDEKSNSFVKAVNPKMSDIWIRRLSDLANNLVDGQEAENKQKVQLLDKSEYTYDFETGDIYDKDNKVVTNELPTAKKTLIIDLANIMYKYNGALESEVSVNGVYKIISGLNTSYLDIKTQKYIDDAKQIKQINDKLREKSGLIQGIQILRQDIETNQNAVSINDNGNISVFNGEEEVEYENVSSVLPKKYDQSKPKVLLSTQKTQITNLINGYKYYTLAHFDSVQDLLYNEKNGARKYIYSKLTGLSKGEIEVTEDLLPNENNYNTEEFLNKVIATLTLHYLNSIGSGKDNVSKANRAFSKFIKDYFDDYMNGTNQLHYTSENTYGMNEAQFNGMKLRFDNFVKHLNKYGSRVISAKSILFHEYKNGNKLSSIADLIISDVYGNVSIVKVILDDSSWITGTKEKPNKHFVISAKNSNQQLTDEQVISNELIAQKSLFESQYRIKVSSVGIMPFVVSFNKESGQINNIVDESKDKSGYVVITNPTQKNKNFVSLTSTMEDLSRMTFYENEKMPPEGRLQPRIPSSSISKPEVDEIIEKPVPKKEEPVKAEPIKPQPIKMDDNPEVKVGLDGTIIGGEVVEDDFIIGGQAENGYDDSFDNFDEDDYGVSIDTDYRIEEVNPNTQINIQKELEVLKKILPQLSEQNLVRIKDLFVKFENKELSISYFNNNMITISSKANNGTLYHEAFHFVFKALFSPSEQLSILNEARIQYGDKSDYNLIESLAESFSTYMQNRNDNGLIAKIKSFFEDLISAIKSWFNIQPDIKYYFYKINKGEYANRQVKKQQSDRVNIQLRNNKFNSLNETVKQQLLNKGWSNEIFNSLSNEERRQVVLCLGI